MTIRDQVFEVIVRQALAGAPWRELCVGPMRVNNISEQEVDDEVNRRLRGYQDKLPDEVSRKLEAHTDRWKSLCELSKKTDLSKTKLAVAELYRMHNLEAPLVVQIESPAELFTYFAANLLTHGLSEPLDTPDTMALMNLTNSQSPGAKLSAENIELRLRKIIETLTEDQTDQYKRNLESRLVSFMPQIKSGFGRLLTIEFKNEQMKLADKLNQVAKEHLEHLVWSHLSYSVSAQLNMSLRVATMPVTVTFNELPTFVFDMLSHEQDASVTDGEARPLIRSQIGRNIWRSAVLWDATAFSNIATLSYALEYENENFYGKEGELLKTWVAIHESALWFMFFENICFVGKNPNEIELDRSRRLHSATTRAVEFVDGFKIWALEGVVVPKKLVESPSEISLEDIERITNIAVRRLSIELYGTARYLVDSGAELIHEDEYGELYRKDQEGDEPLVMVLVKNSTMEPDGSYRKYFLRVPPQTSTAKEAVAWSFSLGESDYSPDMET